MKKTQTKKSHAAVPLKGRLGAQKSCFIEGPLRSLQNTLQKEKNIFTRKYENMTNSNLP